MRRMNMLIHLLITKENSLVMNKFLAGLFLSLVLLSGNSCSTGSDPEPEVLDVFTVPAQIAIQIHNIVNDLAMEVNGIAMHNLNFEEDTIKVDVSDCLDALVYRDASTSVLDSIVLDYGTTSCASNGASFQGKIVVDPKNEALSKFDIRLRDFSSSSYDITGTIEFESTTIVSGSDFLLDVKNANFSILGSDEITYFFPISSVINEYTLIENDDNTTYTDDIFEFTSTLSGGTPDGMFFNLESVDVLTYDYSCKNINGGDADFSIVDLGDGTIDYGDPDSDCDTNATLRVSGKNITIAL